MRTLEIMATSRWWGGVRVSTHVAILLLISLSFAWTTPLFGQGSTTEDPQAESPVSVPTEFVRAYLWPQSEAEFESAEAGLLANDSLVGVGRLVIHDVEEVMRTGRPRIGAGAPPPGVGDVLNRFNVETPGGRIVPVTVRLPSRYTPDTPWPLMFAMHGGPPGSVEGANRSAGNMIDVWVESAEQAGWIVASPAMVNVVSEGGRTAERLPYEIFHPEEARAVIDAVRARFNVAPDRIVSTGISLGSNFSIGYAAAHPDWFSAIVPVSTEGESREHLLRNLASVPVYILEGTEDRNIRGVGGPRALDNIMHAFGYDLTYREFGDRAHEGFSEHYGDVLRWLDSRPRNTAPRQVLRVPHEGIMGLSRRLHWIETDTRQALVRARVVSPARIDITARWAGSITLYLNDRLVNLDETVQVRVNGIQVFEDTLPRSIPTALEEARRLNDPTRVYPVKLTVEVPTTPQSGDAGAALWSELGPVHPEGQLSFWEMYAVRALEERVPTLGFDGTQVELPTGARAGAPEQVAVRITAVESGGTADSAGLRTGDLLLTVGGEPFFRGRGGVEGLHHWMIRELRSYAMDYPLAVWRDGGIVILSAAYALGPYVSP